MTNDYKYELRRHKRGDNCIGSFTDANGVGRSFLCGCGSRTPPGKKHKTRIARRNLQRKLLKELKEL